MGNALISQRDVLELSRSAESLHRHAVLRHEGGTIMDALKSMVAIMLVGTIGIAPSSCTTMGGGASSGGTVGDGTGGGGGGYVIEFPSGFAVL